MFRYALDVVVLLLQLLTETPVMPEIEPSQLIYSHQTIALSEVVAECEAAGLDAVSYVSIVNCKLLCDCSLWNARHVLIHDSQCVSVEELHGCRVDRVKGMSLAA
jgi:hypothetical protein